MRFDETIKAGDLLASLSVMVSVGTLIYAFRKDRIQHRRDRANSLRQASALMLARMERWREVALALYDDIQVPLTEADGEAVRGDAIGLVRDKLWRDVAACRAELLKWLHAEELELSFAEAIAFDPNLNSLFRDAVALLKAEERAHFDALQWGLQRQVLAIGGIGRVPQEAELGNRLRFVAAAVQERFDESSKELADHFRKEVAKLLQAKDADLVPVLKVQLPTRLDYEVRPVIIPELKQISARVPYPSCAHRESWTSLSMLKRQIVFLSACQSGKSLRIEELSDLRSSQTPQSDT
jgi:hypothetical protein